MMRIGLIVVGLGTLTIMELGTASRIKTTTPDRFEQLTFDRSVRSDTLEKADRVIAYHSPHEATAQPTFPVGPTTPLDVTSIIIPKEDRRAVGRAPKDKNDHTRRPKPKPKHASPSKPRPYAGQLQKDPEAEQTRPLVELKPCKTSVFDELLQTLNLASRCQT